MDMGYMSWACLNRDPERVRQVIERNEQQSFVAYQAARRVTRWVADLRPQLAQRRRPAFAGRAAERAVELSDAKCSAVDASRCPASCA